MAVYTENYNLILPEAADPYDVEDYNENFSIIDAALLSAEGTLENIESTLDSMSQKIDALAAKGSGAVKSIQVLNVSHDTRNALDQHYSINTVDPSRSVVFMTHMHLKENSTVINFTLYANNLHVTATAGTYAPFHVKFQIVEFY